MKTFFELGKAAFLIGCMWWLLNIVQGFFFGLLQTQQLMDAPSSSLLGEIIIAAKYIAILWAFKHGIWPYIKNGWPPVRETLREILSF